MVGDIQYCICGACILLRNEAINADINASILFAFGCHCQNLAEMIALNIAKPTCDKTLSCAMSQETSRYGRKSSL